MTRIELAMAAGLSAAYVARLEAGRANPRVATLGKIAAALGIAPTGLFPEDQDGADSSRARPEPLADGLTSDR